MAAETAYAAATAPTHRALSHSQLPNAAQAAALLGEIATAPCAFAPVGMDKPLALYGAGDLGGLARDFFKAVGHQAAMAIDRNARAIAGDPAWRGVRVVAPEDVMPQDKRSLRVAVSIVLSPYAPIEQALLAQGFTDIVPFYDVAESFRHLHPLSNGWFAPPLSAKDHVRTEVVLARWHDDVSRAHHLQFLAWRRLREEWSFAPAPLLRGERFFIPEVAEVLHGDEVFVDAGAYHGTVAAGFVGRTSGRFRQIVAIEPDPANRKGLDETLGPLLGGDPRLTMLDCALGEGTGRARFHAGLGYASQLAATGGGDVAVEPLDALGLKPTFLKLHLEGGELAALKGAKATLLKHRPIVAATVYHNADGIWRTPLWLMETLPDYRFLFRLDSWCGTGGVVYGIPKERCAQ